MENRSVKFLKNGLSCTMNENGKQKYSFGYIPIVCSACGASEFDDTPVVCSDCGGYFCSQDCLDGHDCEEEND